MQLLLTFSLIKLHRAFIQHNKPLSSTVQVTDISLFTMITAVRAQAINHYLFDSRFTLEIQKVVIILVLIYVDD